MNPYLARRSKKEPVTYMIRVSNRSGPHSGCTLFQEQILQIAMMVAGFNGSEADELRASSEATIALTNDGKVVAKLRRRMTEKGSLRRDGADHSAIHRSRLLFPVVARDKFRAARLRQRLAESAPRA